MMKRFLNKTYLLLLIPSFLVISLAWSFSAQQRLYYCSDPVPVLDFIPPFIHGSQVGDYFIAPDWVVYHVWIISVITIFLLPLVVIKFREGLKKERSKQKVINQKEENNMAKFNLS